MARYLIPLFIFIGISVFLFVGLWGDPKKVPSQFVNKAAPDFTLQQLHSMNEMFSNKDMLGKVWMLNVWASWCVACRQEHPLLVEIARDKTFPIYGLNYKDVPSEARRWLEQHGDPYDLSIVDYEGKVGINYGVYGVPESFVIDKQGVIRHKVIGPLTFNELHKCVKPIVHELNTAQVTNVAKIEKLRETCKS